MNSLKSLIAVATFVIVMIVSPVLAQETIPVQDTGETLNVVLHSPNPLNISLYLFGAFLMGLIGGQILAFNNPFEIMLKLEKRNPGAFSYVLLGWLTVIAVGVVGYLGLIAVIAVFVLYHTRKKSVIQSIRDAFANFSIQKSDSSKPYDPNSVASDAVPLTSPSSSKTVQPIVEDDEPEFVEVPLTPPSPTKTIPLVEDESEPSSIPLVEDEPEPSSIPLVEDGSVESPLVNESEVTPE